MVSQDRAYTLEVFLALIKMHKQEWQMHTTAISLVSLSACLFLLVSTLGGMQGFEVVWTNLAVLCYDVNYCNVLGDMRGISWPTMGRSNARHGVL